MSAAELILVFGEIVSDTLGQLFGRARTGVFTNDHKLVAAPSDDGIGLATGRLQDVPDFQQCLITGQVTIGIVDRLESVEIDHHEEQ